MNYNSGRGILDTRTHRHSNVCECAMCMMERKVRERNSKQYLTELEEIRGEMLMVLYVFVRTIVIIALTWGFWNMILR